MRIYQRVGENTAISYGLGGIVLLGLFVVGMVAGTVQAVLQMPWQAIAVLVGGFAVMFVLYAAATHRIHGVWPWQPLPLDTEPDEA
jgi:hypothetical protein